MEKIKEKINDLKTRLADANAKMIALDEKINVMEGRKAVIAGKIASADSDLSAAQDAARTAATAYALGNGDEAEIVQAQTAVMKLEASRAALEAALLVLTGELENLDAPMKKAVERAANLQDLLYGQIAACELQKAKIFIQRAFIADRSTRFVSFAARDGFKTEVANLAHCRQDETGKILHELSVIYGLDI